MDSLRWPRWVSAWRDVPTVACGPWGGGLSLSVRIMGVPFRIESIYPCIYCGPISVPFLITAEYGQMRVRAPRTARIHQSQIKPLIAPPQQWHQTLLGVGEYIRALSIYLIAVAIYPVTSEALKLVQKQVVSFVPTPASSLPSVGV